MQLELLSLLGTSDAFDRYAEYIKTYVLTDEVGQLVKDIGIYYTTHPEVQKIEWESFKTWFQVVQHPAMKKDQYEVYDAVVNNLVKFVPDPAIVQKFIDLDYIAQIKTHSSDFIEGKSKENPFEEIGNLLDERERKKIVRRRMTLLTWILTG